MSNILDMLSSHLSQEQVQAISKKIGASPEQTQTAIQAALPTLLGALGRKAESPGGAEQVHAALSRDHDGSIMDNLGGLFGMVTGGGKSISGATGTNSVGDSILGHLLGGKKNHVQETIGKSSGINASQAGSLLSMLAPIVLGAVGKQQKTQGLNPSDLAGMLRKENQSIEKASGGTSFIGRMLDQDGDGDFDVSDMMKMGMSKLFDKK